ncbi:MAG: hypothetical protein U1F67_24720 [Rubrivivax sp.]
MAAAMAPGVKRQRERRPCIADAVEQQQLHVLGTARVDAEVDAALRRAAAQRMHALGARLGEGSRRCAAAFVGAAGIDAGVHVKRRINRASHPRPRRDR